MRIMEESTLASLHRARARPLMDVVDALKDLGMQHQLSLPQIVVVGDQSSGKSSVLEAISGVPFPKGSGLCTRCPVRTIMKRSREAEQWSASAHIDWRNAQPAAAGEIQSPEHIPEVIRQLTEAVVGSESAHARAGLSRHSIVLHISAPSVPDLTLIDLPGIVRTTTSGQSQSVIAEVDAIIQSYIEQEHTIILAVVPSNQDIATVDILERAHHVDPKGHRTIGVLTKPDLVPAGEENEVMAVLTNVRKPLRLGYYMVRNLSEAESREQPSIAAAQETAKTKEQQFFEMHPIFSNAPERLLGVRCLTEALIEILVLKIKQALPGIRAKLQALSVETQLQLASLGGHSVAPQANRHHLLMQLMSEFCALLRQSIRGEYRDPRLVQDPQLRLHALYQQFYKTMQWKVEATSPELDPAFTQQLAEDMASYQGRQLCGFLNNQVFFSNVVRIVESWRPLVEHCRATVCGHTRTIAGQLVGAIAETYAALRASVGQTVCDHVSKLGEQLQVHFEELFAREEDPFTTDRSLMDAVSNIRVKRFEEALQRTMKQLGDKPSSESAAKAVLRTELGSWYMNTHGVDAQGNVEEMKTLIQAYWEVARRRFVDNICLTIERAVASVFLQEVETACLVFANHATDDQVVDLLTEDAATTERRKQLTTKALRFRAALQATQAI